MESFCAPNIKNSKWSCFSLDELRIIAHAYNEYSKGTDTLCNKTKCITIKPIKRSIDKLSKKDLWKTLDKKLSSLCDKEYCWLDLAFTTYITDTILLKKLHNFTFKPPPPKQSNDWVSNHDIHKVMKQYELLFPHFKFMGALPSDFYTIIPVNYNVIFDYQCAGIIFNTDTFDKPGRHWVAFFIDNINKKCEYFDSNGLPPNKQIRTFIMFFMNNYCKDYIYVQNNIKHQYGMIECGIYSIFYLLSRLIGENPNDRRLILDDEMEFLRKKYFRPH